MADKYNILSSIYQKTCKGIISTPEEWLKFLAAASKNYRFRFDEQVFIYARRPDATAVLTYDGWRELYGRWVNRGTHGIAVFADESHKKTKYYFDVSDTHGSSQSKPVAIWKMNQEYAQSVLTDIKNNYGSVLTEINSVPEAIITLARKLTDDNSEVLASQIDTLTNAEFISLKRLIQNSITYMVLSRLELNTKAYFTSESFSDIDLLNSSVVLSVSGAFISAITKVLLTEISRSVVKYEKSANYTFDSQNSIRYNDNENNQNERSIDYGRTEGSHRGRERLQLHENDHTPSGRRQGGRHGSVSAGHRTAAGTRTEIRDMVATPPSLSEGIPSGDLLRSSDELQIDSASQRGTGESGRDVLPIGKTDSGAGRDNRETKSDRYDGVGAQNEQYSQQGRGNDKHGDNIRLEYSEKQAEENTSAFVISQEIIDEVLTRGSNFEEGKMRIYEQFEKSLSVKENADFLKREYGTGGVYPVITGTKIDESHDSKGIRISKRIGSENPHIDLNWNQVEKRIAELIRLDRYLSPKEKEAYPDWLQKQEERRAETAEQRRNREILSTTPPQPETQTNELQAKYEYHLGDTVTIGAQDFEILSFDENRVLLYDTQFPLFQKEMPRDEFDRKVQENPMNDHLKDTGSMEEDREPEHMVVQAASISCIPGYVVLSQFSRDNLSPSENVILGKVENYNNRGVYDNSDYSAIPVSKNGKMYSFLSASAGWTVSQQHFLDNGIFTAADYTEYARLCEELSARFPDFQTKMFEIDIDREGSGVPFNPNWNIIEYNASRQLADQEAQEQSEARFNGDEFEKLLPREMRFKEVTQVNGNEVFWVTQEPFTVEQLREFQQAVRDYAGDVKKFYVTPRDLSGYDFAEDRANKVLAEVTPDSIFKDDYVRALQKAGMDDYLKQNMSEKEETEQKLTQQNTEQSEQLNNQFTASYREYSEIKRDNPEGIVLFQNGDFFEAFGEDAQKVAEALDLVITSRSISDSERVPMVGFPQHTLETYMNMLTDRGYDLAVASLENGERKVFNFVSQNKEDPVESKPIGRIEKVSAPVVPAWEQKKKEKVKGFDLHPDIPMSERHTFDLKANPVETVGKKERFRRNIDAINILKNCEFENRFATPEEQVILSKYVGWGGIPEAFDENNSAWANEFIELYTVLSPDEYAMARESTLTAFYTPPEVTIAIYNALEQMGFRDGNLLEPSCGIGNFIGMLPHSMENARIYGVELDPISAGIAQQLYQNSSIAVCGFEEVNVPDSFFDGVVGNVPFGDFKVLDKRYDKHNFLIHDYFFAKSLDKLRPGGVMALVTSKGTMDKANPSVRKYIAQRADLLGAIRLPNNTFKGNAGTEVVSDILFLQKRDRLIDIEPDWVYLDTDDNGIKMNSYFVQHPEMVLGKMKMVTGRFGIESTCEPYEDADLESLLNEAISHIHAEITDYEAVEETETTGNVIPADPAVRNFSYTVVDDLVYFREDSIMTQQEVSATVENRIKGMIKIRDCVRELIELQTEDYPDSEIKQAQKKLNTLYDNFTKKYGLINSKANTSAFITDSSYPLLSALEVIEDGKYQGKADMFTKRTIKPHIPVTDVDTASEALAVSIGEKATIDMSYMQQLSGKTEQELYSDLKGVIFLNPLYANNHSEPKYLMADEYLSGNVREKLALAKWSAEADPEDFTVNVEALEKVQPKDLSASEIAVRLGATWIPPEIVEKFIYSFLETPMWARWNIKVHFSPYTGEWNVEGKSYDRSNVKAYNTYGTSRINAYKIIEETLNLKDVCIFDYIEDDDGKKKAVLNKTETAIAQSKQELIKQGFQEWIWADPTRREKLTKLYNEKFNSIRPREYDGSHITFSGMNPEIELREHQKNAVAHIIYGGNTLLAHAVGAGKTYEMAAAAQESKRLGLCNKSLFVVPNHLTEQWAAEYLRLYPSANILVATKKDFETKNRKKFCGRIATGDYDAVIIGHSQFEKIPMSIERQRAILEQQLNEVIEGIADLKRQRGENFSIKQLEKSRKSIKQKLEKLNDQSRKDDVVTFEELGVDKLFIDESHYYKNLFLYTKMRNVGGIAQTEAQKSSDLFMKCRYLDEITGGRGTVFATGTPISNSMVELYTIQRYLQYETLAKNGLQHFDSWASTFGETVTAVELTPEGTGYRAKTRFARFYNLPELMAMFKEVADIKTADMLNLPVPKVNYHNISVKPSEIQKEMVKALAERAEKVHSGMVDATVDNMLKITNDGRKLALDQRLINPALPDYAGSKLNACVNEMFKSWEKGKEKRLTQLFFCDLSTPKNDGEFSVYDDIRKKLIEKGVPPEEIKFIHEAKTEAQKQELFEKVRRGDVRVLMGSTQKMGAGTNVQDKLAASFDLDCPWRPSDLEQRLGRSIRQGNTNAEVDVFRFVTEETFDAYLYQLVEGKQKFASQIMTSKSPVRSAEDIDETALSYAEIKMLATGNPYIKEKMDLDIQVQKLKLLKSNYLTEKYNLEDKIIKYYPQQIASLNSRIEGLKADVKTAQGHPKPTDDRFAGMEVKGVFYSKKAEAGKAIIAACKEMNSPDPIQLGSYRGFTTELFFDTMERQYVVRLKGQTSRNVPLGEDLHGNITRLDNGIERFEEMLKGAENELENTEKQFETAKAEVEKPFLKEDELKSKMARLDELNIILNLDKKENEIVSDNEPEEIDEPQKHKNKVYER